MLRPVASVCGIKSFSFKKNSPSDFPSSLENSTKYVASAALRPGGHRVGQARQQSAPQLSLRLGTRGPFQGAKRTMDDRRQPRRQAIGCRSRGFLQGGLQLGRRRPVAEPLVILPPIVWICIGSDPWPASCRSLRRPNGVRAPLRVDARVKRAHDDGERVCDHTGFGSLVAKTKEVFASFYKKKRLPSYVPATIRSSPPIYGRSASGTRMDPSACW